MTSVLCCEYVPLLPIMRHGEMEDGFYGWADGIKDRATNKDEGERKERKSETGSNLMQGGQCVLK